MATSCKRVDLVHELLKRVSDDQLNKLTHQNKVGNTILHEASTSDKLVQAAKEMLIKAPELLNIRNNFDVTPLYRSVEFGRMDTFKFLDDLIRRQKQITDQEGDLEADPEVYYHRKNKTTVLHTAVVIGSFDLALFIATRYKHLVDEQDNDGMTALQLLAFYSLAFESRGGGGCLKRLLCSRVLTEEMSTAAGEAPSVDKEVGMAIESSSDSSYRLPKEMTYLDDVEEFKSTMRKDGNDQDQRLFLFKSPVHFETGRVEDVFDESSVEKCEEWINDKAASRSSRKSRKASEKRQRMRSISKEEINVKDVKSLIYYGGSLDNSQNENLRSDHRQKHHKRTPPNETRKSLGAQARVGQPCHRVNNGEDGIVHKCSLEDPCYFCTSDDKDKCGSRALPVHNLKEKVGNNIHCPNCRCFTNGETNNRQAKWALVLHKPSGDYRIGVLVPKETKKKVGKSDGFGHAPYLRAMTMPVERSSDCHMVRSNTFSFQQASHVHPKLPDYDQ